jgi:hypothetical protein
VITLTACGGGDPLPACFTRLDAMASGSFLASGTDARCTDVSGTVAVTAPVD